jgi:CRP-like cAMP-binding protein
MIKRSRPQPSNSELFDPIAFLNTAAGGRTLARYRKRQLIFSQGDAADSVIYIKKGNVKVCVISKDGKEAVVAILGADEFRVKDV